MIYVCLCVCSYDVRMYGLCMPVFMYACVYVGMMYEFMDCVYV